MTLHKARLLTDAIIAQVATVVAVGDGEKPAGVGWQGTPANSTFVPYAVVHPLAGGVSSGTIYDPHDDSDSIYQVSCFGATRAQCELVSDDVFDVLLTPPYPSLTGRSILFVQADMEGGVRRDDSVQPPIYMGVPRFRYWTSPTTT